MELLELYNSEGVPTGKCIIRGNKNVLLNDDEHIAVGVVFIQNREGKFLIQKTSESKGGEYSSTGGHINYGETPKESILREIEEELGVKVDSSKLHELGFLHFDKPIRFLFYLQDDININDIKVQDEEVDYVEYLNIEEIQQLINNEKMLKSHGILFKNVLDYISN